jgi:hypothetical protein
MALVSCVLAREGARVTQVPTGRPIELLGLAPHGHSLADFVHRSHGRAAADPPCRGASGIEPMGRGGRGIQGVVVFGERALQSRQPR